MRCTGCGMVLDPGGKFCGHCGAPYPQLPPRFAEVEWRYAALRARHEAGELDEAAFHAEVHRLLIEDGHGGHWMVGEDGGDWFWYDGRQWVRRDPPRAVPGQPPAAPAPVAPPPAAAAGPARPAASPAAMAVPAAQPAGGRWLAAGLGALAVVAILAAAVWWLVFLTSGRSAEDGIAPSERQPAQLIDALAQAEGQSEAQAAVEGIVGQGFSLGLLDEQGNQLNPNVAQDAISLPPDAVATYATVSDGSYYRTIDHVVGFLADAGVTLASTGRAITTEDLLPDLQAYVDGSFAHPDDPESALGLLLASGPELKVPDAVPQMDGSTPINPLAGLLLLGDLLVGLEMEAETIAALPAEGVLLASAGPVPPRQAQQESLQLRVTGLITTIQLALDRRAVQQTSPGSAEEEGQLSDIERSLSAVKWLIYAYEFSDHLVVRIFHPGGTRADTLTLKKAGDTVPLEAKVVAVFPESDDQVLYEIPFDYEFRLMARFERWPERIPLFGVADAVFVPPGVSSPRYESDWNGHWLSVRTDVAQFHLKATQMDNETELVALIFGNASLPARHAETVIDKYIGTIQRLAKEVTAEELKEMLLLSEQKLRPLGTMSPVKFKAQEEVEPAASVGATTPVLPAQTTPAGPSWTEEDCACPELEAAMEGVVVGCVDTHPPFFEVGYSADNSEWRFSVGLTIRYFEDPAGALEEFEEHTDPEHLVTSYQVVKEIRTADRYVRFLQEGDLQCQGYIEMVYRQHYVVSIEGRLNDQIDGTADGGAIVNMCEYVFDLLETHAKAIVDQQF